MRICNWLSKSLIFICLLSRADANAGAVLSLLQSMANGGPIPAEETYYRTVNERTLTDLTPGEIARILDQAGDLLADPRVEAQDFAIGCFLAVDLRLTFDSGDLIAPHLPQLEKAALNLANSKRAKAFSAMSLLRPSPPARTMDFTQKHLADRDNTINEFVLIAGALLNSKDQAHTRQVIEFTKARESREYTLSVLQQLAAKQSRNQVAREYIHSILASPDTELQGAALHAVSRFGDEERDDYRGEIASIANDTGKPEELRSAATGLLRK